MNNVTAKEPSTKAGDLREMVTAEQVLERIPISRTTLRRLERLKLFPASAPIAPTKRLWFKDEVVAWQLEIQNPNSPLAKAIAASKAIASKEDDPKEDD